MRFPRRSKRLLRRFKPWVWLGLALMVCIWLGLSSPVRSQPSPLREPTAKVVVNGSRVFDIQGVGNFTAAARARSINQRLQEEVQKPEPPEIEVVIVEETGLVTLQSRGVLLATVTEVDLKTPGYQLEQQANDWARLLEEALRDGQRERSPAYLQRALLYGLVVLGGAIAIHLLLRIVGRRATRALNQWFLSPNHASTAWEEPAKFFWRLGLIGLKVGLWLIVAIYITDLFPQLRSWRHTVSTLLTANNIALGDNQYSALNLLLLLALTIGLWSAAQVISKLFRNYVLQRARIEPRLQDILSILVQYGLLFLGVIVLLQILGIDASSLAILASLLGVGLGFGIQNITNNFISGFIITLERPIQVGDFIKIGDLVGIVKQVGARSTEINTLDQVTIIVPNSRFLESEVINWSHGDPVSRLRVPVGVAYGSDIAQVKTALLEAVKRHPEVLLRPKPEIWFQSFGDSSLNFEIMVWTGDPRKQFRVKSDLNYAIEDSLRRHGLEVPFPQQDLHLRSPQLDEILELLKQQAIGISGQASTQPSSLSLSSADLSAEAPVEQTTEQSSPLPDLLANLDLEALAEAMQGPYGIELQAHPEQPETEETELTQPTYFTGTDAVDWLEQKRDYTHDGAMLVGQWLLHKGLIIAEIEGQDFEDSQVLYRFYQN
ncbi:mechanosensitive ion channel domain-containing protein [Leptolyngbya sp. Heron Island J]|uniref:mechanosensitive ion channel domain-containing protein n=1 Tax=Leptolyngbya sp. Heron Island J TaxID=1385935 RepID=UPI0004213ADE|nr:mechanosensitive ion channel domain-containing protein [Leptolyngbya sp. Heron Island J]